MFYTYSIKNIENGKFYIGSRTAKCMLNRKPEDDLGVKYFSSSKDKELRQAIKDGKVEYHVLQEYDYAKVCWKAEQQLIALYWKFFGKDMSYNHCYSKGNGDKIFSTAETTRCLSTETKEKIRLKLIGKKHPPERILLNRLKHLEVMQRPGMHELISIRTKEAMKDPSIREKMSKSKRGKKPCNTNCKAMNNGNENVYVREEDIEKYLEQGYKFGLVKVVYKWQTAEGDIIEMGGNAKRYHSDWICLGIISKQTE